MIKRSVAIGWVFALAAGAARAEDAGAGKAIYAEHCIVCHGIKGAGNGPSGRALNPKPLNFITSTADQSQWFEATKRGTEAVGKSKNMPEYGSKLSDRQIRTVLAYVNTLKLKQP